jgi:hypothetical protein
MLVYIIVFVVGGLQRSASLRDPAMTPTGQRDGLVNPFLSSSRSRGHRFVSHRASAHR